MKFINSYISYHTLSTPGDLYESSYVYHSQIIFFGRYMHIYMYKVKLVILIEGDPKDSFSIATKLMCRGERWS